LRPRGRGHGARRGAPEGRAGRRAGRALRHHAARRRPRCRRPAGLGHESGRGDRLPHEDDRHEPRRRVHPAHGQRAGHAGMNRLLSFRRLAAMLTKEVIQMRRDRVTFAMMLGIPLLQLVLFGFAINSDPKGLPAALVAPTQDRYTRAIVSALELTGYYRFTHPAASAAEADRKSTRLNSSHVKISYAVFCLKKKTLYTLSYS